MTDRATLQAHLDAGGFASVSDPVTLDGTLWLRDDAGLSFAPGATVTWTGPAGGAVFGSEGQNPLSRALAVGNRTRIDAGNAGVVFDLRSPQFCEIGGFWIDGANPALIAVRMRADAAGSAGSTEAGHANALFCDVHDLLVKAPCHSLLHAVGTGPGTTPKRMVTLNRFANLEAFDVRGMGIRLAAWCDNNVFDGFLRVSLRGPDAIGVDLGLPSVEAGVYANHWDQLAVDAFGDFGGRTGLRLGKTKCNVIESFHCNPEPELGAINTAGALSYFIRRTGTQGTTDIKEYRKGYTRV